MDLLELKYPEMLDTYNQLGKDVERSDFIR